MEALVKLSPRVGLHGRPGALLVDLAQKNSKVTIILEYKGKKVETKSILNLLALGVKKGEEVRVFVEGENAELILKQVEDILQGIKS